MKPVTVDLFNRQQAMAILKSTIYPYLGEHLQAGARLVMTVGPRKRTQKQNKRYWGNGVLKQIAEQAVVNGKMYSAETYHEMFKRMFIGFDELPNGEIIGKSSTVLSTAEFCDFCTAVEAWAATDLGVIFYDLEQNQ